MNYAAVNAFPFCFSVHLTALHFVAELKQKLSAEIDENHPMVLEQKLQPIPNTLSVADTMLCSNNS